MNTDVTQVLSRLRPEDAARTRELFPPDRRAELLEDIISTHRRPGASPTHVTARGYRLARPTRLRPPRAVLLSALGAMIAAAIAAIVLGNSALRPQPATAAVAFETTSGGDIVATVTNPFAAQGQLEAAFAARGFHITVTLIPVSPSLVGTAVYISDAGGASSIEPLQRGHCVSPGGGCPVGLKIPKTFKGQGYITLGRPAKPGEQYLSAGQPTAPGEAMHGMQFKGRTVATVLALLRRRHVAVPQYRWEHDNDSKTLQPDQVPGNWHVDGASPWAAGQVLLFVSPSPR